MKFKNLLLVLFLGVVCFVGVQDVNAATIEDLAHKIQGGDVGATYDSATSELKIEYNEKNYIFNYDSVANVLTGSVTYTSEQDKSDFYSIVGNMMSRWFDLTVASNLTYHYDTSWVIGTTNEPICKFDKSGACLNNTGSALEFKLELSDKLWIFVTNGYGNTGDDNTTDTDNVGNEGTGTDNPYTGSEDVVICGILLVIVGGFVFTIMRKNGKIAKI